MSAFDVRDLLKVAGQGETATAGFAEPATRAAPLAETVADLPAKAISPVVIAGLVRAAEFVLVIGLGAGLHLMLLHGVVPFGLTYAGAVVAVAALAVTA